MKAKNLVSLAVALAVALLAIFLGGDFTMFINPAGLLLVIGGTLAGVFLAFPLETLTGLWEQLRALGSPRRTLTGDKLVRLFVALARLQRSQGAVALEAAAAKTGNPFLQMGTRLLADRVPRAEIRERLEQEFEFFASRHEAQRAVLGLMGRLAPAFGLAGTMIGLIRMLHNVSNPAAVSEGMSVALLTTFYGIMLANLIVLPLERKLSEITRAKAVEMTLIIEGILGLAAGENGAAIEARLRSFGLPQDQQAPGQSWGRRYRGLMAGLRPARSGGHDH